MTAVLNAVSRSRLNVGSLHLSPRFGVLRGVQCFIYATLLIVSTTLEGCANWHGITPEVHATSPASLDVGAAIRARTDRADSADSPPPATGQWPQTQWWRTFGDPQLNAWVATAIADSPSQAVARARVREAMAIVGVAQAATLPSLDASLSLSRQHWPESGYYAATFAGKNNFNDTALLHFDYPIDLFGAAHNGAQQALDTAHATAAQERAVQLSVETNVVRAYVQMSLQYALLDVQQKTLADQQHVLDLAERRFQAGIGTQLELSEAQAPLPQTRLTIEQSEDGIELVRHQLAALAGKGPGAGDALTRPALHFDVDVTLPSTMPAELIGHRPDIVARRWQVEAQARNVDVHQAAFYPNINLLANGGGSAVSTMFAAFTRMSSMGFTAGPAVTLPIFEGGRLRASLGAATAQYDIAVAQYNAGLIDALHEIADQIASLTSLQRQRDEAQQSVQTAQRSYDIAMAGFRRGLSDYLNVLSAEDRLLLQQLNVKRIEAARYDHYAQLMSALGGGLATPSDSPLALPPTTQTHHLPHAMPPAMTQGDTSARVALNAAQ